MGNTNYKNMGRAKTSNELSNVPNVTGLSSSQVYQARKRYGINKLEYKKNPIVLETIKSLLKEPMILLLACVAGIYFFSGQSSDGIFLLFAVAIVSGISLFQDSRSRNALAALERYNKQDCKVIRNGKTELINSEQLVVGDTILLEEGNEIPADCSLLDSNDFSVDESILTGESMAVFKAPLQTDHQGFMGTTVASGHAMATVIAIAKQTKLGKIGQAIGAIKEEPTPLSKQINHFVNRMILAGTVAFTVALALNYLRNQHFLESLLGALTMAMSVLPEEIPVAFATFMALGAWRLMKKGIIAKKMRTVETLGSATVICVDKTGTLTENRMSLVAVFALNGRAIRSFDKPLAEPEKELIQTAMWASEPSPFDPMEVALHAAYATNFKNDQRSVYRLVHEYPLAGTPPMMTHVFQDRTGKRIIAAKGAPEALIRVCKLNKNDRQLITGAIAELGQKGYRVLGVGSCSFNGKDFPEDQEAFEFDFMGLVAFYDPPKKNIAGVLKDFYAAGIAVKIITGDNAATTAAIAQQIGFQGYQYCLSGEEILALDDQQLQHIVKHTNVFTRMFPLAKLRIINALKANGEVVAMTGDGVNDGPALKAAHIGIAMGNKGTEIAKKAAALILINDDLSKMIYAIGMGRRIYANLKKAVQYIISIHIPIILMVLLPLVLGWHFQHILLPIHVVILELIMGPTCSIVFENEPAEKNTMAQKPRPYTQTFFNKGELVLSLIQGLVITIGAICTYQYAMAHQANELEARTMVFGTLVSANILLTLCNRSFYYSLVTTMAYRNRLMPIAIGLAIATTAILFYIRPVATFFGFQSLDLGTLLLSIGFGSVSVIWIEAFKWYKRAFQKV